VVEGVEVDVLAATMTKQFEAAVGDHLVGVHVRRRAGPTLDHVDDEVPAQFALQDLVAGC
jgi:hypothetical protein